MSLVDKFINEIGYTGLFSMEFIRGKDGRDYFLEINMRNDGNSYCVTAAGCNLPFAFYQYMASGSRMSFSKHVRRTYLIPDLIDLSVARQQGVPLWKWIFQFMTANAHTLFSWRDMGPFLYSIKPYIRKNIRK